MSYYILIYHIIVPMTHQGNFSGLPRDIFLLTSYIKKNEISHHQFVFNDEEGLGFFQL